MGRIPSLERFQRDPYGISRLNVKGGVKVRRVAGRSKTAALPEDFCENERFYRGCVSHGRPGIQRRKGRKCIATWNSGLRFVSASCGKASASVRSCVRRGCIGRLWRRFSSIPHLQGISVPRPQISPELPPIRSGFVKSWSRTSTPTGSSDIPPRGSGSVSRRTDSRGAIPLSRMRFERSNGPVEKSTLKLHKSTLEIACTVILADAYYGSTHLDTCTLHST